VDGETTARLGNAGCVHEPSITDTLTYMDSTAI